MIEDHTVKWWYLSINKKASFLLTTTCVFSSPLKKRFKLKNEGASFEKNNQKTRSFRFFFLSFRPRDICVFFRFLIPANFLSFFCIFFDFLRHLLFLLFYLNFYFRNSSLKKRGKDKIELWNITETDERKRKYGKWKSQNRKCVVFFIEKLSSRKELITSFGSLNRSVFFSPGWKF